MNETHVRMGSVEHEINSETGSLYLSCLSKVGKQKGGMVAGVILTQAHTCLSHDAQPLNQSVIDSRVA